MKNNWPTRPLGELVDGGTLSYGIVQPGNHSPSGVPVIRVKDIKNGQIDTSSPLRVEVNVSARHKRTVLRGGEVLVSIVGTVGQSAIVPDSMAGWNVARAIAVIRPRDVSAKWIQLCLQSSVAQSTLSSMLNTTVQATLNLADLKRIPIPLPPIGIRQAVVEVLGALDDKIAANDRVCDLADQLCAAEVRKSATAGRRRQLRQVLTLHYGKALPSAQRIPGNVVVYGSGGTAGTHSFSLVDHPGIVVGRKGTVGSVYWADGPHFPIDTTYYVKTLVDGIAEVVYYVLRSAPLSELNSDSAVPGLNRDEAYACHVNIPDEDISRDLSKTLRDRFAWMKSVREESKALASARDELLPLLISGKIQVREVEKVVEEVV